MRIRAVLISLGLLLLAGGQSALAQRVEEFYGIWVDENQPHRCSEVGGEGPWVGIAKEMFFEDNGDPCTQVKLFVREGKLHLSAVCAGEEQGAASIVSTFTLLPGGKLTRKASGSGLKPEPLSPEEKSNREKSIREVERDKTLSRQEKQAYIKALRDEMNGIPPPDRVFARCSGPLPKWFPSLPRR